MANLYSDVAWDVCKLDNHRKAEIHHNGGWTDLPVLNRDFGHLLVLNSVQLSNKSLGFSQT